MGLRYPAAAVVSELKHLAAPATLDTPPQDLGIEDHSTGAPLTVRLTDRSLDLLEDLLAIEMLLARDVLVVAKDPRPRLGRGTSAALEMVEQAVTEGSTPDTVHRAVKHHLADWPPETAAQIRSSAAASSSWRWARVVRIRP